MADLVPDNAQTAATVVAAPALSCLQGSTISAGPEFSNGPIRAGGHTVCVRKNRKDLTAYGGRGRRRGLCGP